MLAAVWIATLFAYRFRGREHEEAGFIEKDDEHRRSG